MSVVSLSFISLSGIDSSHEDLGGVSGFSGQSSLPYDTDASGHGSHVAGTIAGMYVYVSHLTRCLVFDIIFTLIYLSSLVAARENDIGVVGVAPAADLYIVRVFGDNGSFLFSSGLVAAVEQCVSAGAKVINMSLGGPLSSNFENNAFASLLSQGVIPIAAGKC